MGSNRFQLRYNIKRKFNYNLFGTCLLYSNKTCDKSDMGSNRFGFD